ncbi:MAG: hypothetical protein U1A24_03755 [Cypionkella sp.]|uniref:hypothetical protein n=1 Tax=Cypionkella sp. TaxID=2811411 RepID=UPI002AB8F73E|nr:hypothetical protein [Cypionkella sp.]MDZ4309659.1 hypothetical protein [Cypionkella sp.]
MTEYKHNVATFVDSDTGVELNSLLIKRYRIEDGAQTRTVLKYWKLGIPRHIIAAMMGVDPCEVWNLLDGTPGDLPRVFSSKFD